LKAPKNWEEKYFKENAGPYIGIETIEEFSYAILRGKNKQGGGFSTYSHSPQEDDLFIKFIEL
jgi:hypothetical protein